MENSVQHSSQIFANDIRNAFTPKYGQWVTSIIQFAAEVFSMGRLTIGKSHYQEQTSALVFLQSKFFSVLIEFFIEFFKYKTAVLRKNAVSIFKFWHFDFSVWLETFIKFSFILTDKIRKNQIFNELI